jgi:DUF3040 family protein
MEPGWESRAWMDLERRLRQDPAFADRIRTDPTRSNPAADGLVLGAALIILVPIVMLLAGWPGVAVTTGLVVATWAFVSCRRRYRDRSAWPPADAARGGMTGAQPDAVFVGGPHDGVVFAACGASLVEVPADQVWHRYVPTGRNHRRGDRSLEAYDYDGAAVSSGPAGNEIRLHGARDE